MWICSHLIEIKLMIDNLLPMKYCVLVNNTFSFLLWLITSSLVTIKTAHRQVFHLNNAND